jgi:mRNA interferase RelE/StbE
MPAYEIAFRPRAAKAFQRLGSSIKAQISRKLSERATNPRVAADKMRDMPDAYRLKFRSSGIRLVYLVRDSQLVILVLSVGAREREEAYEDAVREFRKLDF